MTEHKLATFAQWLPPDGDVRLAEDIDAILKADTFQTFIHVKSNGRYTFVGHALIQSDKPLSDMSSVVVYRGEDGRLWVRDSSEFEARFKWAAFSQPQGKETP